MTASTPRDAIIIRGAREHNLKNIDIAIPHNKLVVITGVSGSGKSSLAFDTLYAEGQRRYVESLSAYARQFISQMEKPDVERIEGLCPAIAIEQKPLSHNPRSTVATVTEIYDYLRVLYARAGTAHCPQCGKEVRAQSAQEIVARVAALPAGTRFQVLAPLIRSRKGEHAEVFKHARTGGYTRVRVDGEVRDLGGEIKLAKTRKHTIELVIDRLVVPASAVGEDAQRFRTRVTDSVETALRAGEGLVIIDRLGAGEWLLSEHHACAGCGVSFPALSPAMFSFNSPLGMCPTCHGLGTTHEFDPALFVVPEKTLHEGGLRSFGELGKKAGGGTYKMVKQITDRFKEDMDTPWKDLGKPCRDAFLFGGVRVKWKSQSERATWNAEWDFEGTVNSMKRRYLQTGSEYMRRWYETFMSRKPCAVCKGGRLRPESAGVTVTGRTIGAITGMNIREAAAWIDGLLEALPAEKRPVAREVAKEIGDRLRFMLNVGLHYLTLDRSAPTLSGGEGQRIRLASQIGSRLRGVLYVLDEPSIGLHARDNLSLLAMLRELRDIGNSVVVIEHDAETIRSADWVVDMGPGPGVNGGRVVAAGPPASLADEPASLTGQYIAGRLSISAPGAKRRTPDNRWLTITGARQNNLRKLTVRFPIGLFTCVTGVSGSGKSSLVTQTLRPALARALHGAEVEPGAHDRIDGLKHVDKIVNITQEPIGRTPRSNPATYAGVMPLIRDLFALTPEARARGYKAGRFSFNVKGGRCEACGGHGRRLVEMHFLADVWVTCSVCKGKRFNDETLQVRYKGKNIAEVLDMDVGEAISFFGPIPQVQRILSTLAGVGLGYIKLGQSATTLSGGEAQRVKLACELARRATGDTVYILDEPTTGLHFADIQKLLNVLHQLTDAGNTAIVIEHNLDVIKTADWIIDLGPEGGTAGGWLVAEGTPEKVAQTPASYTGQFLKELLAQRT
ncbi:MAG: excinuclease ABC subunit UvrA [Planctomycetota bacterium]